MDARVKAILAHFTPIGWVIALVLNMNDKEEFSSFFIRQTLGIWLAGLIISGIPLVNIFGGLVIFAFWLLSLIYAIQGEQKEVPFGGYFQEWFKGIN
ncbi:MAG: hypothetical protein ACERKD_23215 [Prolixibacteraceae bacterium]